MANKNKILILVPSPNSHGGVSNYFISLKDHFTLPCEYFIRGVRNQNSSLSRLVYPFVQLSDYLRFILRLLFNNYSLVQINTSLGKTGLIRDYLFIIILLFLKKKYVVFFRGIDNKILIWVESKWLRKFKSSYLKAEGILVLSKSFKEKILSWGFTKKISVETTVVDPSLIDKIDLVSLLEKQNSLNIRILFLSRIEKKKGIYEAIDAIKIVQNNGYQVQLFICGDGSEFERVKNDINKEPNINIKLEGYVENAAKIEALNSSHIFLFPSYGEGMPNSLLEAMAFGLPVITSSVGGIPDFFENDKMGLMTNDISPNNLANLIELLITNKEKRKKIAEFNYLFAKNRFYVNKVISRLENFYLEIIEETNDTK